MKKLLFSLILFGVCFVNAQLTITTNMREDGTWDKAKEDWIITSTTKGLTVLNFNKEFTSFRHITDEISSEYEILDWDYDEKEILYEMKLKSDAGNEYDFMIDGINEYLIFFYYDDAKNYRMVRHTMSDSVFKE